MSTINLNNKIILVTGVAGFIGSNLVKRIYHEVPSATVIGIDNMNDYYDVALKEFRLNELTKYPTFTFVESKALYDNLYPSRIIVGTDVDNARLAKAAHTFAELLQEGAIRWSGKRPNLVFLFMMVSGFGMCCGYYQKIVDQKISVAGGSGTRLYPLTKVTSKQLLPIYDKPMIYYPMSVLMKAGIRDILIISTPQDTPRFENLLGDGHQFGVNLTYAVQPSPDGLAQAFIIGEEFIGNDTVAMVLGDNIFAGHGLKKRLQAAVQNAENGKGATVFGYYVDDPERFGIVEFDKNGKAISIEEKPEHPKSNYCVTGLYFYDNRVVDFVKNLKPSARGELEITDLNRIYLEDGSLNVELLGQGFTWLDTGTHESLVDATNFVKTVEQHQHRKIACLEEIAYLNGWISKDELMEVYEVMKKNQYGQYLKDVMDGKYQEHLY